MKIIVDYESSWRNSFLDGSNNEPLPKEGRKFVSSMTELKKKEHYISREITKDTVMGILNRLIGDQRKLYQSRENFDGIPYYFANIENSISFVDKQSVVCHEIAYIRNMNGSTDQNSFTGLVLANDPIFTSDFSSFFWNVLALDTESLFDFIIEDKPVSAVIALDPISIINRFNEIGKLKPIENTGKAKDASLLLQKEFEKYVPFNKQGKINLMSMYCSALYLQLRRLELKYDMRCAKSSRGGISGISNNGVTLKDFMGKYTTGGKKLIYGNPYIREELVKGEGKITNALIKASGQLEIKLDIDTDNAIELKKLIDNAGVSAFYLGKKGLAYVSHIDVR